MLKRTYAVQPYEIGAKNRKKSLVLVIPTKIAEECHIDASSILAIDSGVQKNSITFQIVNASKNKEIMPAAESSKASSKQASHEIQ
jgi:hypothetical protein